MAKAEKVNESLRRDLREGEARALIHTMSPDVRLDVRDFLVGRGKFPEPLYSRPKSASKVFLRAELDWASVECLIEKFGDDIRYLCRDPREVRVDDGIPIGGGYTPLTRAELEVFAFSGLKNVDWLIRDMKLPLDISRTKSRDGQVLARLPLASWQPLLKGADVNFCEENYTLTEDTGRVTLPTRAYN